MGDNYEANRFEEDVDLVIIGGGPTGLLSGLLARQLGITVSIVDAKPGPLDLGRADALNARTQQYLEVAGILDELLPLGLECNTSSTFAEGDFKSRQNKWWVSIEHCQHPNFLMIGQPVIEEILANKLDTPVHYNEQAVAVREDENGVTLTTDRGRTVRGKFALAADGARSTVRSLLGIGFSGTKPEMVWAVLDTFIDTDFPVCSEIITFQLNGQSRVSWIPRERGMARFYILLDGEITQEKAENSIREHMAPHRVDFRKTEWFSTFDVKERIASTFVSKEAAGRILLAGDAAHVHSVNGGQGLNTGIADAFALSWRIAMVVKNTALAKGAAANLIQSYDIERRTVAQGVIDVAAALVRDTVHTAKQYVSTIEKNAGYITGMGVSYDGTSSPLITESEQGIWKSGRRCPDLTLTPCGGTSTKRLYSMVPYGKYLILKMGAGQGCRCCFKDEATHLTLIRKEADTVPINGQPDGEHDSRIFESDAVAAGEKTVVVVRPDMYIGFVGEGDAWKDYMGKVIQH